MPIFDLDQSRRYWRHAPAGAGKLDTDSLIASGGTSLGVWETAFRSRLLTYPEEEQFLRTFAPRVRDRRIVSIGSGLGFHELYYAAAGAQVTCCDIVPTNLQVIEEIAARTGTPIATFGRPDLTAEALPGPADVVFIYGCLMHMPVEAQRALFARAREAVTDDGCVVLMVYGWEFARRTCGWTDPSEFDPRVFARASDPTVGSEACPWSDWHDGDKLVRLAGEGARIVRQQSWNDGQFFWYELSWTPGRERPAPFFDDAALENGAVLQIIRARDCSPVDGEVARRWRSVSVRARPSHGNYVLASPVHGATVGANAIAVDLSIEVGALSVGLLDVDAQRFVSVGVRSTRGRHRVLLLADPLPARFQIVISNHQPAAAAAGTFVFHGARVLARPFATMAGRGLQHR